MDFYHQTAQLRTRRQFLKAGSLGLGAVTLAALAGEGLAQDRRDKPSGSHNPLAPKPPHFAAKAKRVIYLHLSGAPPQQELFDYKPKLVELHMKQSPHDSLAGQ